MNAKKAKKVAARILKCGESKVWIDPQNPKRVKESITTEDVRGLIAEGLIRKSKEKQKTRAFRKGKRKSRKTGPGKKRGTKKARMKPKKKWMKNVRAQRKKLREISGQKKGMKVSYRKAYKMIKGGFFRGKKHIEQVMTGAKK